ncbi:hypothetical protein SH661x_003721 [Planctomicrobium sp. SH661]|uniref:hypothetical protein n=1 Tax=Planctomicrobium sp. SH661 TaxID=3448124 RepID=UPI003F5C251C
MADEFSVLVLCKDLFFGSQLHGAVQRAGRKGRTCLSQAGCLQQLVNGGIDFIVIDLELPELNIAELKSAAGEHCRLIGFGPHVREELFRDAQSAGCDVILTRGQASSQVEKLLRSA